MSRDVPLSSKLDLITRDGYALAASRQPRYAFRWHVHDCAMLLWPRTGVLDSAWDAGGMRQRGRFARGQVLLLPAYVAHSTRSDSATQQHGELYLAPSLARRCEAHGALQVDGAAQAMLDALWAPALAARALPALVRALLEQLAGSVPATPLPECPLELAWRWSTLLDRALDEGRSLPTVAASATWLGVSTRTLQRACLQAYGHTPVTLRRMRLARAARERLAMGDPAARVSAELGFANSGHLGRLLKAIPA
jgi:AraC-like DNA-binding protein